MSDTIQSPALQQMQAAAYPPLTYVLLVPLKPFRQAVALPQEVKLAQLPPPAPIAKITAVKIAKPRVAKVSASPPRIQQQRRASAPTVLTSPRETKLKHAFNIRKLKSVKRTVLRKKLRLFSQKKLWSGGNGNHFSRNTDDNDSDGSGRGRGRGRSGRDGGGSSGGGGDSDD